MGGTPYLFLDGIAGCAPFPVDGAHLLAAVRYVELNPVRAALAVVEHLGDYPWSSAGAHLTGTDDNLVRVSPLLSMGGDWRAFLSGGITEKDAQAIHRHESTGRHLGNAHFLALVERTLRRMPCSEEHRKAVCGKIACTV